MIKIIYMTSGRLIALIMFLIVVWGFPQFGWASSSMGQLWIHRLEGEVLIKVEGNDEWSAATLNFPLLRGDRIWTGQKAWVEINHMGGSTLRMSDQCLLKIEDFQTLGNQDQLRVALSNGMVYAVLNEYGSSSLIVQVDTPNLSLQAESPTVLKVESIESENSSRVSIIQGEAVVETEGTSSRMGAGRTMIARDGGYIETESSAYTDSSYSSKETSSIPTYDYYEESEAVYVPEPLHRYTYELNRYGRWAYVHEYGRVWVPSAVPAWWAPFRYGRWIWRSPHYVWISYWPWGWIPFHYGRWSYGVGIGWYWIPPYPHHIYWCPGAVGWWQTGAYIYWLPLAPGELYYGYGYFGPWSVNLYFYGNVHRHPRPPWGSVHHKHHNVRHHKAVSGLSISAFLYGKKNLKYANAIRDGHKLDPASAVPQPNVKAKPQTMVPNPATAIRRQDLPKKGFEWSDKWKQKRRSVSAGISKKGALSEKPSTGKASVSGAVQQKRKLGTDYSYDKFHKIKGQRSNSQPKVGTDRHLRPESDRASEKPRSYGTPSRPSTPYGLKKYPGSLQKYSAPGTSGEKSSKPGLNNGTRNPDKPQPKAPGPSSLWNSRQIPSGKISSSTDARPRSWKKVPSWKGGSSIKSTPSEASRRGSGQYRGKSFSYPRKSPKISPPAASSGSSRIKGSHVPSRSFSSSGRSRSFGSQTQGGGPSRLYSENKGSFRNKRLSPLTIAPGNGIKRMMIR